MSHGIIASTARTLRCRDVDRAAARAELERSALREDIRENFRSDLRAVVEDRQSAARVRAAGLLLRCCGGTSVNKHLLRSEGDRL